MRVSVEEPAVEKPPAVEEPAVEEPAVEKPPAVEEPAVEKPQAAKAPPAESPVDEKATQPPKSVQTNQDAAPGYALLVGIEYTRYARQKKMDRLPGCHRDMNIMKLLLKEKYGIPIKNIKILMDDGKHAMPSLHNIRNGLEWLKNTNSANLWFCYSGHGSNVRDRSGDEPDGRDEALVPDDFLNRGYLTDDELRSFAAGLLDDAHLTCIFDCCHSGTMMDLPYYYQSAKPSVQGTGSKLPWPENGPTVVSLSACADHQTSVSAYNLNNKRIWQGAMTYAFNQVTREGYEDGLNLLQKVSNVIKTRGFDQITYLSTSHSHLSAKEIQFPIVST
jgi:hypothetical protein